MIRGLDKLSPGFMPREQWFAFHDAVDRVREANLARIRALRGMGTPAPTLAGGGAGDGGGGDGPPHRAAPPAAPSRATRRRDPEMRRVRDEW